MAFCKVSTDRYGQLRAKIQVTVRDPITKKPKNYTTIVQNENNLTESKFKKYAQQKSFEFEEEIKANLNKPVKKPSVSTIIEDEPVKIVEPVIERPVEEPSVIIEAKPQEEIAIAANGERILTFPELYKEWQMSIKINNSQNYYDRSFDVEKFVDYLKEKGLDKKPISAITVRDIELFFNEMMKKGYNPHSKLGVVLKKHLPKTISFRELDRKKILNRNSSYRLNNLGAGIKRKTADKICKEYNLDFDEYFAVPEGTHPYSVETIKNLRKNLRTIFYEAVRYEWITTNPVSKTKVGGSNGKITLIPVKEKEVFSFKEAKQFLRLLQTEIPDEEIYKRVPLMIMLLTGLRNCEVCGLRWTDIDFENEVIHVRKGRHYSGRVGIYEKEPKTKTSIRNVPMPENLIEELKKYKKWFEIADSEFNNKLDEYYLAVNIYRQPEHPGTSRRRLKDFEQKYNLKNITCHGLRHTYCSLLLAQNVPIQTVSKYMGHSDSTVTLKVYSHFIPDTQEKVRHVLNSLNYNEDNG